MNCKDNFSLLAVSTEDGRSNIGDYIQALASSQFLPFVDSFIERETLGLYNGAPTNMIMNAWYMHHPENWPPSSLINPLFVAAHFNVLAKEQLLSRKSIEYLKMHAPIGCRDIYTVNMLREKGIDAYFSGCMTLTLGYKYKSSEKTKDVYFVDPAITLYIKKNEIFNLLIYYFQNIRIINSLYLKMKDYEGKYYIDGGIYRKLKNKIIPFFQAIKFHRVYSNFFEDEILKNAQFVCQESKFYLQMYRSNEELLKCAEKLVQKYSTASLVVTSRIHSALPCLGLETPVLYVYNDNQSFESSCRMEGLVNLFNLVHVNGDHIYSDFFKEKIGYNNIPSNRDDWRPIAANLICKCKKWIETL